MTDPASAETLDAAERVTVPEPSLTHVNADSNCG